MRVIYTPDAFSIQRVGGVSRYFCELVEQMRRGGQKPLILGGAYCSEHLRGQRGVVGCYVYRIGELRNIINRALCRWFLKRYPEAIVHQTYFSTVPCSETHRLVYTVHDMLEEIFPTNAATPHLNDVFMQNKKVCCERADHLIAISESTKRDLVKFLQIDPAKISVVYHGNSLTTDDPGPSPEPSGTKYLLFVGKRRFYKNFPLFLEAYAGSRFLRENFRLICFGEPAFNEEELKLIAAHNLSDRVSQCSGDDQLLARYYRWATAFVYPSLYEGFGLPLLEAMGQGCPVFCGKVSSLPEVGGDAVAYFDASDALDMRQVLETTLANPAALADMAERGRAREKLFSWERCYRETLKVYEAMAAA